MSKAISYKKGSIIYFFGDVDDRIFILQKGLVVFSSEDLKNGESEFAKTGEFFGVKSALGKFPREETASVQSDSVCVVLTVAEFEKFIGANKAILLKMLRVFSNQLRKLHKKTTKLLETNFDSAFTREENFFSVAKAFFNDSEYLSCCDVCEKFVFRYPTSQLKMQVLQLYRDSKLRHEKLDQLKISESYSLANSSTSDGILGQFSLEAFKRFQKTFERGKIIITEYEPGETFYLIQRGEVRLVKCINGESKNLDILKAGEFFGEMAILDNSPRSATAVAHTRVEVLEFNKENFEILITNNPQIAIILLKLFCKRIYDQKRRLKILRLQDSQARIADVFLMFREMQGQFDDVKRFRLTPADVAHWAGLKTDQVMQELHQMEARKKITIEGNYITLNDVSFMKQLVSNHANVKKEDSVAR